MKSTRTSKLRKGKQQRQQPRQPRKPPTTLQVQQKGDQLPKNLQKSPQQQYGETKVTVIIFLHNSVHTKSHTRAH